MGSQNTQYSFPNRVITPIVYGNALYKQDPTQVISITAMSRKTGSYLWE
jgi:hypothetical protein